MMADGQVSLHELVIPPAFIIKIKLLVKVLVQLSHTNANPPAVKK